MATFDVDFQLQQQLGEIFRRLQDATEGGLEEALLFDVLPTAVRLSPVKSGTNRRSIDIEVKTTLSGKVEGSIFTQSGYGGWLEVGTSRMGARPYLRPAVERNRDAILKAIKRRIP